MKKPMKRVSSILLTAVILFTSVGSVSADSNNSKVEKNLIQAYEQVIEYAQKNNIPLDMSLETFQYEYEISKAQSVSAYVDSYYDVLKTNEDVKTRSSSSGAKWYYNTGTALPQKANYASYQLLQNVKKGDVIYEANGGFGITGHAAIVEGKFYDSIQKQYYIRIIEAIDVGVVRSVLDDERLIDKAAYVCRVPEADSTQIDNAVDFSLSQLGKKYALDFAKDYSANEKDWYCSELVWASYYNQGINIETTGFYNEPGITPRDIKNSSKIAFVSID